MNDENERSVASTGSVEPVAWAVQRIADSHIATLHLFSGEHEANRRGPDWQAVPLYRSPTLTDAERQAVEAAAEDCRYHQDPGGRAAFIESTLRGLLERLK